MIQKKDTLKYLQDIQRKMQKISVSDAPKFFFK